MGISSRRRFLTMLLTAGAAAMLASAIPNAITNNGQGVESAANNSAISSIINESRANQLITNGSTVNITVPTASHISAIKTFPINKT